MRWHMSKISQFPHYFETFMTNSNFYVNKSLQKLFLQKLIVTDGSTQTCTFHIWSCLRHHSVENHHSATWITRQITWFTRNCPQKCPHVTHFLVNKLSYCGKVLILGNSGWIEEVRNAWKSPINSTKALCADVTWMKVRGLPSVEQR